MPAARPARPLLRSALAALAAAVIAGCTTATPAPTASSATPVDIWAERGPITLAAAGDHTVWSRLVDRWNTAHADQPVTLVDLPVSANQRHTQLTERIAAKSGEYTVIATDVAWTAEFANAGGLVELPSTRFATGAMVPAAVASATWDGKLYAYPAFTDAGVLYYRRDLLSRAGVAAPRDWSGLRTACSAVPAHSGLGCLGIALAKDEDLSVAFYESVQAAGGTVLTATGTPEVDSSAAAAGLGWLIANLGGLIPDDTQGWSPSETAQEFAEGHLLFQRNWASAWQQSTATGLSVELAQLPGMSGAASATLGGENLAISAFGRNRGTAADFVAWVASADTQRAALSDGSAGPVLTALYDDADLIRQHPYLSVLNQALLTATPRPESVRYGEVTQAVQSQVDLAIRGERPTSDALEQLQAELEPLFR